VIDAAGKTVGTGKYIEVWRRINGKWPRTRKRKSTVISSCLRPS
jgi:hypothetical protein